MKKGQLVVIDGIDGSGKTTQINLLAKSLKEKEVDFEVISFPQYGKNEYADYIHDYLSGKFGEINSINPYDLAKVYCDDRKTAREQILSWLGSGKLVIANRYVSSSKAHLGAHLEEDQRKQFINWINKLEYGENNMPKEDLTILLNVDPRVGQKNSQDERSSSTNKDHLDIHEDNLKHLQEANKIFLELSKQELNWVVIDCMKGDNMQSPEKIHQQILKTLKGKIF